MPLKKSKSKNAFKENVKREIASGKDPSQAVAIAYSTARAAGAGNWARKGYKKRKT